jgi:5-carboxymethyl-2-hydroxymuconate isomerase
MPHITIDYTANLEAEVAETGLVDTLHQAAIGTGIFPLWGIRTLAQPHADYRVAGGEAGNGFIKVVVRIAPGRDLATRKHVTQTLFDAAVRQLAPVYAKRPLGFQLELTEFDTELCLQKIHLDSPKETEPA